MFEAPVPTAEELSAQFALESYSYMEQNPRFFAEHSFVFFLVYYLKEYFSDGFGNFQYGITEELNDLRPGQHMLMLLPREHGKSTLITFAYILWCTVYRKKRHMVIVSAVGDTSQKFLANIKNELRMNALILRDFGDLTGSPLRAKRVWRQSRIHTSNEVVIVASSTGATVRGLQVRLPLTLVPIGYDEFGQPRYQTGLLRPDLIICDDIIDDKRVATQTVRNKLWNWFWMNLFAAMQMDCANMIVVGTPLHEDDIVQRLVRDGVQTQSWKKYVMPAANQNTPFDADGNPIDCLFPEKWGRIDYNRPISVTHPITREVKRVHRSYLWWRMQELGPAFNTEFLLRTIDDNTRFFHESDFNWYVVKSPSLDPRLFDSVFTNTGKLLEYLPSDLICVTTVDPAGTDSKRMSASNSDPDYTVVMTTGYSPSTQKFYLVAVNRMRTSPFGMLNSILIHLQMFSQAHGAKYIPDPSKPHEAYHGFPFFHLGIGIETVAFQKVLAPMLEEIATALHMYPIVMEIPRGAGVSKRLRAQLPSVLCQKKLLVMPYQIQGWADENVHAALAELLSFPQPDQHDDVVDAFTDGIHILHAYSLQLGRGLYGVDAVRELLTSGSYGIRTNANTGELIENWLGRNTVAPVAPAQPQTPMAWEVQRRYNERVAAGVA